MANNMLSMVLIDIIADGHRDSSEENTKMSYDRAFLIHVLVMHSRTQTESDRSCQQCLSLPSLLFWYLFLY